MKFRMKFRMKFPRAWPAAAAAIVSLGVAAPVCAQSYPNRPVSVVVPFSTGGDADLSARNLAPALQKVIGESVVVLNRAGASGSIGSQVVK